MNTTKITRTVRRENVNRKIMINKNVPETSEATRFYLPTFEDYAFRHASCLHLRKVITNETMKLIWRKKMLEVIQDEVNTKR